jgi:quinol monooxygenase YgiN
MDNRDQKGGSDMLYGIVLVKVKPGKKQEFLDLFKENAARVKQEKGCVRYMPAVDVEIGIPIQQVDKDVVTVLEEWESMEALQAHLASPNMAAFFEKEKVLVESTILKMVQEA